MEDFLSWPLSLSYTDIQQRTTILFNFFQICSPPVRNDLPHTYNNEIHWDKRSIIFDSQNVKKIFAGLISIPLPLVLPAKYPNFSNVFEK